MCVFCIVPMLTIQVPYSNYSENMSQDIMQYIYTNQSTTSWDINIYSVL